MGAGGKKWEMEVSVSLGSSRMGTELEVRAGTPQQTHLKNKLKQINPMVLSYSEASLFYKGRH